MDLKTIKTLTDYLHTAETEKRAIKKLTASLYPSLTIDEGYLIQAELNRQKEAAGNKIVAYKMGLTSEAKLRQMKVTDPIYGFIFDYMIVDEGSQIKHSTYIHPRVEPEIGFVLKAELQGPAVTKEEVLKATDYIFPAIEIIDSRYENFDFTMADVVADNTSAAGAVFGTTINKLGSHDLTTVAVTLLINGEVKTIGTGAAVLNHPAEAVARLANMLFEKGQSVKAGVPILTGGVTEASPISRGDYVQVRLGNNLGEVAFFVN